MKYLFGGDYASRDRLDELLGKFSLSELMRIGAWLLRFKGNSRLKKHERMAGLLTTQEIQDQHLFSTECVQKINIQSQEVKDDKQRLGLKVNNQGV